MDDEPESGQWSSVSSTYSDLQPFLSTLREMTALFVNEGYTESEARALTVFVFTQAKGT